MKTHIILVTYGEPSQPIFKDQWRYSNQILSKLTRLVAPIPKFAVPFIGAWRGYTRMKLWKEMNYSSPLEEITESQASKLNTILNEQKPEITWSVQTAYEFRHPFLSDRLSKFGGQTEDRLFIIPMYLPESDFTSEISRRDYEKFINSTKKQLPEIEFITFRPNLEQIAEIMAQHVRNELKHHQISFSELKQYGLLLGCHGTVIKPPPGIKDTGYKDTFAMYQLLEKNLADEFRSISIGWLNHRLGGDWTTPTLEQSARQMLDEGIVKFIYYPFGFIADNAETQLEGKTVLEELGIKSYIHLPCLNSQNEFINLLATRILNQMDNTETSQAFEAANV